MKRFLLGIAALLALSCSNDDGKPAPKQLLSKVTVNRTDNTPVTYVITYDDKNRVHTLEKNDGQLVMYTYAYNNDNQISEIRVTGATVNILICNYDSDKRLTSIDSGGNNYPAAYSPATNTYTVSSTILTVRPDGNLSGFGNVTINYDNSKKGGMYGIKGNFQFICSLIDVDFLFIGPTLPITGFNVLAGSDALIVADEFDANDYITKFTLTEAGQVPSTSTYIFEYTNL